MKNLNTIIIVITCFFISQKYLAQNHPTIAKLATGYKATPKTGSNTSGFMVIPQSTISLVPASNVSKIYFKILDSQTQVVLYQVNYSISSSAVIDNNGRKLFENNNGIIFISNGQSIPLTPYEYQITTEDSQQALSPVYSTIQ